MRTPILTTRHSLFDRWFRLLGGLFIPRLCPWCHAPLTETESSLGCGACREEIKPIRPPFCPICSLPVRAGDQASTCARCAKLPPAFDLLRAAVEYTGPVKDSIRKYKYGRDLAVGHALGAVLANTSELGVDFSSYHAVIPIPAHRRKARRRRFNQALGLARALPGSARLPLYPTALRRTAHTPSQAGLSETIRRQNLRGVFEINPRFSATGKKILLIDDVATTGATLSECARLLKKAGALRVDAAVVARAPVW